MAVVAAPGARSAKAWYAAAARRPACLAPVGDTLLERAHAPRVAYLFLDLLYTPEGGDPCCLIELAMMAQLLFQLALQAISEEESLEALHDIGNRVHTSPSASRNRRIALIVSDARRQSDVSVSSCRRPARVRR